MIVRNNRYQSASFFTTSNSAAASVVGFSNNVSDYFSLRKQNELLSQQNAFLRDQLEIVKNNQSRLDSTDLFPSIDHAVKVLRDRLWVAVSADLTAPRDSVLLERDLSP